MLVRNALFKASDEIEKKFESMPITFSQALTMMKNDAYMIFGLRHLSKDKWSFAKCTF
ncbi:hypothetical protein ACK2GQ_16220 [Clostridioides difficile]